MLARRALALGLGLLLTGLAPGDALAKKGKKKAPVVEVAPEAPPAPEANAEALLAVMGNLRFGMTLEETYEGINKAIDARYKAKIARITDLFEQNKLRKLAKGEKETIHKSFEAFTGNPTSWDVSMVDKEFDHLDDEAMIVQWELDAASGKNQRRFYFFVDGKLWKMFIGFSGEMFPETMTFAAFHMAMEARFGTGALAMRLDPDGIERFDHVYWKSPGLQLRALDLTKFFSTYALSVSDDAVEGWITARRNERNPKLKQDSALVNAVSDDPTRDQTKAPLEKDDVIDRMLDAKGSKGSGGDKGSKSPKGN